MKKIKLHLGLIVALLCLSCGQDDAEKTVTVENRYALTIPSFLSKTDNLNTDASLQYQHLFNEFYVLVIDEPKTEMHKVLRDYNLTDTYANDLDGYTSLIFNGLLENIENPKQTEIVETHVNGLPARLTTIDGKIDGVHIFYTYGIYEGQDQYYQVIVWTLIDRQDKYQPKMEAILHTLKELNTNRKKGMKKSKADGTN